MDRSDMHARLAIAMLTIVALLLVSSPEPRRLQPEFALLPPPRSTHGNTSPNPPAPMPEAASLPRRMFGPWYGEALVGVEALAKGDVDRLKEQLRANPDDFAVRLKLMAYLQRDRVASAADQSERLQHAFWLIEHHPDSEILHSPIARFRREEMTSVSYQRAVALWNAAAREKPGNAAVQWNAATFFGGLDADLHVQYLEATAAAEPSHPFAILPLAHYYALSVLEGGTRGARSLAALEASPNVWILSNAAHRLQNEHNRQIQWGKPLPRAVELAERLFQRSLALNPNLDRNVILPQIDLQQIARAAEARERERVDLEGRAEELARGMRRLALESFPQLPPTVLAVLRGRQCLVPQVSVRGAAGNVVRGRFFSEAEAGWAVFCSVNGTTSLLAFRNDQDANPDTLTSIEDRHNVQEMPGGKSVFSRAISAVDRDVILRHYRAYGGPKPPPIHHQGIDEGYLEKASITWYFYQGKWLELTGAD